MRFFFLSAYLLLTVCLSAQSALSVGQTAPPITVSEWLANDPGELTGKFIVLEFWTTWCGPCIAAVPHLNELQREFARPDLAFVALSDEKPERIRTTLKRVEFLAGVGTDRNQASQIAYGDGKSGLDALPKTVLIDDKNVVRWIGTPKELDAEILRAFLAGEEIPEAIKSWEDVLEGDMEEEETALDGGFNVGYFMDVFKASSQNYYFELEPLGGKVKENGSMQMGEMGGHYSPITLSEIYTEFFPTQRVDIPEALFEQTYSLLYLNKDEDPDFLVRFEADLLRQLSLTKTTEVRADTVYNVYLTDRNQLDEVKDAEFSSISEDEGQVVITNYSLSDAIGELNKYGEAEWRFTGNDGDKLYAFIIQLDGPEAIRASLANYGLEVKAVATEKEVIILR